MIEDPVIPCDPNGPGSYYQDLHKETLIDLVSEVKNRLMGRDESRPMRTNKVPTKLCEWAGPEKVLRSFFRFQVAQSAGEIIQRAVLASEHVPGIESVLEQKPEEDFMTSLTCACPQPLIEDRCQVKTHEYLVGFGRGKLRGLPDVLPRVLLPGEYYLLCEMSHLLKLLVSLSRQRNMEKGLKILHLFDSCNRAEL